MTTDTASHKKLIRLGIFLLVVGSLIAVVIFFSSRLTSQPTYRGGKVVGKVVPDVTVEAQDGSEINMRDYVGKTVFINFFNSWCIPCQEEEPALIEFARQHEGDPNFVFIGIVRDDSRENIEKWAQGRDVPFTIAYDDNEAAAIAFGTTGQPETYAIDPNGRVVASLLSRASVESLNEMWDATQ
jgi:cytochrome c biogenesis protein CcmG/thiol:disulfide interchange protein DsbE